MPLPDAPPRDLLQAKPRQEVPSQKTIIISHYVTPRRQNMIQYTPYLSVFALNTPCEWDLPVFGRRGRARAEGWHWLAPIRPAFEIHVREGTHSPAWTWNCEPLGAVPL